MRIINVTPKMDALLLGKQGENKSTKFLFDVSGWLEDYPGCTITLVHRRPHESSSYPCVLTTEEDGRRSWVINSADLAKDGDGQAELKCTLGDVIEKDKRTWKTKINKSLSGDGNAPAPWESVMDDIEALVGDAQDAAADAEEAAEDSEAYAVGKRGGEDVGSTDPAYHNNSKYYAEQAAALLDTKADKVSGATNGNFAGLDSNGNLMDSGKKPADFYELPGTGIQKSDLSSGVQSSLELADSAYQKPGTGIPAEDLASGVIPDVSGYYTKPSGGIPKTDLASGVQSSMDLADSAYQKPGAGIPASDLASGVVPDITGKADKTDTVLNTTLSRGRTPNSTVGDGSIAFGYMVEASGSQSVGFGSLIEAKGNQSFAHGYEVVARGARSSAGGYGTIAQGVNSDVSGMYNVTDSYENWPDWQPNTFYDAKAKIHLQVQSGGKTYDYYYICNTPHTSGTTWDSHSSYWDNDNGKMNYANIVGNGKDYRHRSNAYALDWDGNGHYAGDVYVGCNADGSGGVKIEPVVFATDAHTREIFATV